LADHAIPVRSHDADLYYAVLSRILLLIEDRESALVVLQNTYFALRADATSGGKLMVEDFSRFEALF
jgi:hypothetical protein